MRQFISLLLLAFFYTCLPTFAAENKPQSHPSWQLRDLYYHDASGMIVQLELARELSIRFTRNEMTSEEKTTLLAEFSPLAEKVQPGDPSRVLLSFHESLSLSNLLNTANKITASGNAEASLVFFVDNIKAVLEGIVVEPKIVLTPDRLKARMQKYGDFTLRQAINENGAWVFLIDEVKLPLNLLVLTNLVSKDDWVLRAYPRFKFLHDPIVASIYVDPVSGTIGETRTVTFTIRVFDPAITLSTERPEFGSGSFKPFQGSPSAPSSMREVPEYLFERVGDPVRHPVKQEKRSRVYTTSWQFKHYALGEWTIHPLTVPYTKNGVDKEIKSSGFTLVVNSQIGSLKITDMPNPHSLIHSSEKIVASTDVTLPLLPSYWFDTWIPRADIVARYAGFTGMFLGALPIVGSVVFATRVLRKNRKKASERRENLRQIKNLLEEAKRERSYTKYGEVLSRMFAPLSWEDANDAKNISAALGAETTTLLTTVFTELNRRYMSGFAPIDVDLEKLHGDICIIFERVKQIFPARKEAL